MSTVILTKQQSPECTAGAEPGLCLRRVTDLQTLLDYVPVV